MDTSDLAKRMKQYEHKYREHLTYKQPALLRLDMRAGHSFTKGFEKPFDIVFLKTMQDTMKYLCENIQSCVLGFTESDEISLVLVDYKKEESQPWFKYNVNKMTSLSAGMAAIAFNKFFEENMEKYKVMRFRYPYYDETDEDYEIGFFMSPTYKQYETYMRAIDKWPVFDSRAWSLPIDEVTNYFYWRQLDTIRNSIQMVGQANFSQKELQNKTCKDIRAMLTEKNISYDDTPIHLQRGSCCIKEYYEKDGVQRSRWIIDNNIPLFKKDGREYIEKLINFN